MSQTLGLSRAQKILAFIAIFSGAMTWYLTSRYGLGLQFDSIVYVSVARNLAVGKGFMLFDKSLYVHWPPLYPLLLAFFLRFGGVDPLLSARILGTILVGLIVYLSGELITHDFCVHPIWLGGGIVFLLLSKPLWSVLFTLFTEPLFILEELVFFLGWQFFVKRRTSVTLLALSLIAAFACLTRYVGITIIVTGVIAILANLSLPLKRRFVYALAFSVLGLLPLSAWGARNYLLTGTFFGPRVAAHYTFFENSVLIFGTGLKWFCPEFLVSSMPSFLVLGVGLSMLAICGLAFTLFIRAEANKAAQCKLEFLALFIGIYVLFLLTSAAFAGFDAIDNRLLSPIYIPLILIGVWLVERTFHRLRRFSWTRAVQILIAAGMCVCVIYLFRVAFDRAEAALHEGIDGYNTRPWKESETLSFLRATQLPGPAIIYSNMPEVVYIEANKEAALAPRSVADAVTRLKAISDSEIIYLVWFVHGEPRDLLTIHDWQLLAKVVPVMQLSDGTIYRLGPQTTEAQKLDPQGWLQSMARQISAYKERKP